MENIFIIMIIFFGAETGFREMSSFRKKSLRQARRGARRFCDAHLFTRVLCVSEPSCVTINSREVFGAPRRATETWQILIFRPIGGSARRNKWTRQCVWKFAINRCSGVGERAAGGGFMVDHGTLVNPARLGWRRRGAQGGIEHIRLPLAGAVVRLRRRPPVARVHRLQSLAMKSSVVLRRAGT